MNEVAKAVLTAAAGKATEKAFEGIQTLLGRYKSELLTTPTEVDKAIADHQGEVLSWASEISFRDYPDGRETEEVFVPLDIYMHRMRSRGEGESLPKERLEDFLASSSRSCTILGQLGAGKTTAMKHLCYRFIKEPQFLEKYQVLIRIELRDVNRVPPAASAEYIIRMLQDLLRLRIKYPDDLAGDENASARKAIRDRVIVEWLNNAASLIVLDGFDEITLKVRRDLVVEEIRKIAPQLTSASLILTARSGDFSYHIEKMSVFEITPFDGGQILAFAKRWLGEEHGKLFKEQLDRSPYADTAIRPLTLAHLCVIYDRTKRIPEQPKSIYRRIVRLLLEEWDEQKSIVRESGYSGFDNDKKAEFLANLAYDLTTRLKTTSFDRDGLLLCYSDIHENFGLPRSEATKVVDEIETHTGLFLQSGRDTFEFSHKSLQEYLTADFIVKLPSIPRNMIELQLLPNELAVATAISSQASDYLAELVIHHFSVLRTSFQFTRSFVSRLLLEQPNFEMNARVGAALLLLYSRYLESWVGSEEQLNLFIMDYLEDEFAVLAVKIRQRISLEKLLEQYERIETAYTFEGDPVWKMVRRSAEQPRLRTAIESILTDEIWVRESLLAAADLNAPPPDRPAEALGLSNAGAA